MSDDLISRKYLLKCAEYDNNGRLIVPYKYVKNAPTAFDKEMVIEQIKVLSAGNILNTNICDEYAEGYVRAAKDIIEIVENGGLN